MFNTRVEFVLPLVVIALVTAANAWAQDTTRQPTDQVQKVFGLAVDPSGDGSLLLASEYGLLRAAPDGFAEIMPEPRVAVIGLATEPAHPGRLMLSGLSETGAPAEMLVNDESGEWTAIPGTDGENGILLTSLSISRLNGDRIAGLGEVISLSGDGGRSWEALDTTPDKTIAVALSGVRPDRIYAATLGGLMISEDRGKTWAKGLDGDAPATLVASLSGGRVAAFVYGRGLVIADEETLAWKMVADGFADRYLTVLTEDAAVPGTLYAVADTGAVLTSRDDGRTWISYEGSDDAAPERIAAGRTLFIDNCQACHGVGGIGESPEDPGAKDEFGFKAPALNDDMHAWHHSDAALRATIGEGSPRNERMIAWKEVLSEDDINAVVAYVKSTWSIRSLACQGARHMTCMGMGQ